MSNKNWYAITIVNKHGMALECDCYDIIDALGIQSAAQQHAFKKIAYAGSRGHKDYTKDMREAALSCTSAADKHEAKQKFDEHYFALRMKQS